MDFGKKIFAVKRRSELPDVRKMSREQELDFGKVRKSHIVEEPVEEGTEGKHRLQSRHAFLEQEKIAEADEMENSEMSEDKADGEKSPSVSRSRLRKESIRGHPGQDAERDSETPDSRQWYGKKGCNRCF